MQVRFGPELFEYVLKGDFLGQRERDLFMRALRRGEGYLLEVEADEADAIRDACGEQLQRVGFDADYNPTRDGEMLEKLVDLFLVRQSK